VGGRRPGCRDREADLGEPLKKIGEGREAELFLLPDGRVLRLIRAGIPDADQRVSAEAAALAAAAAAGAPAPRFYETVLREGRPGLVMERVEGPDLLTLLAKRPWLVVSVARRIGRLHAELRQVPVPDSLPSLKERIAWRIGESIAVPDQLRDQARSALAELPDGDRLCHGDFHPGNVLAGSGKPVVIDWTSAAGGDPVADLARTWVLLELSPLPPGSSGMARRMAAIGRGVLLHGYARAYLRRSMVDAERLARWTSVRAIERLAEDVPGERERLLQSLGR
jgi:aminoglycoside phosphotransferase (APT) family kinase protein